MPKPRSSRKKSLAQRCHDGQLEHGLSISLRATPDEVVGPLVHAVGARDFRVLDVRSGSPVVLEISFRDVHEKWELVDVEALVHNLNDLFRPHSSLKTIAVLGEAEDMLQLWCLERAELHTHLSRHALDDVRNLRTLWAIVEPVERDT